MFDELRERIAGILAAHQVGLLGACGWGNQPAVLPAAYHSTGLEVECLLPRWAELISHLAESPEIRLLVPDSARPTSRWLEYRGQAALEEAPDWSGWHLPPEGQAQPQIRYAVLRLTPRRIDLIDEGRGWGFRETLDI